MVDAKDWLILDELKKDSRQTTTEIARKTKIPRVTVHDRIQRMQKEGIISRFTVKLNGIKTGKPVVAFVLVRALPNQLADQRKIAADLAKIPDVAEAHHIAGDYDFILKVRAASLEHVGEIVMKGVREVRGVERASVLASFGEIKED